MQVTETHSEGLKREFKVVLPAQDLASRVEGQLAEMRSKAKINGFRPGKVPVAHLKRLYGRSIVAEVVQEAISEANRKIIEDNKLRLAGEPRLELEGGPDSLEKAFESKGDIEFKIALEILPKVELGTLDDIVVEKLVADVAEEEVDRIVSLLGEQNRVYEPKIDGATAEKGDKVTIDFVGKMGDEAFEGGTGSGVDLILGSNSFIPGFEDQLIGLKVGDHKTVSVDFPADYGAKELAGKPANFGVEIKAIAAPGELKLDDEFAKNFGFEDFATMRSSVRSNIENDYNQASRAKWKRALLDSLDKRYSFELPQGLVEQEFQSIWNQIQAEQTRTGKTFADENTTEEAALVEYRGIAERRVRLGLVLAEIGEAAGVKVTEDEINRALMERVRQYPGQEQKVWEYFRSNPQALAQIQAPLFEDKVVDHVVSQAKVTERKVSKEELTAEDEDDAPGSKDAA